MIVYNVAKTPSWTRQDVPSPPPPAAMDGGQEGHCHIQRTSVAIGNGVAAPSGGAAEGSVEPARLLGPG